MGVHLARPSALVCCSLRRPLLLAVLDGMGAEESDRPPGRFFLAQEAVLGDTAD